MTARQRDAWMLTGAIVGVLSTAATFVPGVTLTDVQAEGWIAGICTGLMLATVLRARRRYLAHKKIATRGVRQS